MTDQSSANTATCPFYEGCIHFKMLADKQANINHRLALSGAQIVEVIDENSKLRQHIQWLCDGIEHFTHEDDQDQVQHLLKETAATLKATRGDKS